MKTYCRGLVIDEALVSEAYDEFSSRRRGRSDMERRDMRAFWAQPKAEVVARAADAVRSRTYRPDPITYYERVEPVNGKLRVIGRETPETQLMDYVAVRALMPLFRARIGEYQLASVPGRGDREVRRAMRRWCPRASHRWHAKLDVRKCYPSIPRDRLMALLARECGSADAVWLAGVLVENHGAGLNIGSYLSTWLVNWYLSHAYRHVSSLGTRRRGKWRPRAAHVMTYMDDFLLVGPRRADVRSAGRELERYLADELGLEAKPWHVCPASEPLDFAGWVWRPDGSLVIRDAIFLRVRRAFMRQARRPCVRRAKRCASYWGRVRGSDCRGWRARQRVDRTMDRCRAMLAAPEGRRNGDR